MTDIAITVENLSKRYRIGLKEERHETLAAALADVFTAPIRNFRQLRRLTRFDDVDGRRNSPSPVPGPQSGVSDAPDIIWALRDVSFEVKRGEVVGIIGRNGAGKSTLLKILAGITEPTYGRAIIRGRVGSLLEVGTGMHPELTGRENIYLAGTILGMKKAEIDRKFEEIVEFAEIGKFIDTPIKRYSSGMKVRLGFAIAAHLEPEILLVDEVLAVGDAAFQKKCLGKMGEVAGEGRTVLFVSHQLNSIRRLCHTAMWIDAGRIRERGETHQVVAKYEQSMLLDSEPRNTSFREGEVRYISWKIMEPQSTQPNVLSTLAPTTVEFKAIVRRKIVLRLHSVALYDSQGRLVWANGYKKKQTLTPGYWTFTYHFPLLPLAPGSYEWVVWLYSEEKMEDKWHAVPSMVVAANTVDPLPDKWVGILNLPYKITINETVS